MKKLVALSFTIFLLASCKNEVKETEQIEEGIWMGNIALSDSIDLPFVFEWKNGEQPRMLLHNDEEIIEINDIQITGDSAYLKFPVFNTSIYFNFDAVTMSGFYVKK